MALKFSQEYISEIGREPPYTRRTFIFGCNDELFEENESGTFHQVSNRWSTMFWKLYFSKIIIRISMLIWYFRSHQPILNFINEHHPLNKVLTLDQFINHADDMSPALRAHLLDRSDHSEMLDLFQVYISFLFSYIGRISCLESIVGVLSLVSIPCNLYDVNQHEVLTCHFTANVWNFSSLMWNVSRKATLCEMTEYHMSCIIHLCYLQNFSWIHTSWKKSCKLNVKKSSTNFTKPWTLWWTLLKMKKNNNKSPCLKLTLQIIICKPKAVDIRPQFGFADYA